jgi:hypothetical protein
MAQIAPHAFFTAIWNGERYEIEDMESYMDDFLEGYLQVYDFREQVLADTANTIARLHSENETA